MVKTVVVDDTTEWYFREILDDCRKSLKLTKKELARSEEYLVIGDNTKGFSPLVRNIMKLRKPVDILMSEYDDWSYFRFRKEVKE